MTIGTTAARASFSCNGSTTIFPVPIQAYLATDFEVILTAPVSAGGTQTILTLNSNYTLATSGSLSPTQWTLTTQTGGGITSPYPTGYTLQIFLNPTQSQQTSYVQGQQFPSLAVQTNFDRLTQMAQRLEDQFSRTISAPDGDVSPLLALPTAALRANLAPYFDANGNLILAAIPASAVTQTIFNNFLGAAPPYIQTAAELAAGVTPVNDFFLPGIIDRYGTNTTPGTTDMTVAVAAACAQAVQTGGSPIYGASTYLTSATIPNFHTARKIPCSGIITRNGVSFYLNPAVGQINILNVSTAGNDTNDGLGTSQSFLTLQGAINALVNWGPLLTGIWKIQLAAGTYTGTNASATFPAGLQSYAFVQVNGVAGVSTVVPQVIIDGSTATNGTWGIVANGNNTILIQNILFQNWTNGNGATQWGATVTQEYSECYWNNVYTNNCDWNLKVQQGRLLCQGGVHLGGFNGSSSISGTTHTFGYQATTQAPNNVAITGASGTGTNATITFAAQASAPVVGSYFVVRSINPSGYNGVYLVGSSTTTSITYANATSSAYVSGGNLSYNHGTAGVGTLIANCALQGVLMQENATGHLDFCTVDNCAIGVDVVCSSRMNANFSTFSNNVTCGVRDRMDSNWNNNGAVFYGNGTNWLQYSYGAEFARQGVFPTITCQPIDSVAATPLTGSTTLTVLKTYPGWIQAATFTDTTKTERIKGTGKITGTNGTKTIVFATSLGTITTFVIPATWGAAGATPFTCEVMYMARASANSQVFYGWLMVDQSAGTPGGVLVTTGSTAFNFAAGAAQTLTISGQLGGTGTDTLALNITEPGWETG